MLVKNKIGKALPIFFLSAQNHFAKEKVILVSRKLAFTLIMLIQEAESWLLFHMSNEHGGLWSNPVGGAGLPHPVLGCGRCETLGVPCRSFCWISPLFSMRSSRSPGVLTPQALSQICWPQSPVSQDSAQVPPRAGNLVRPAQ